MKVFIDMVSQQFIFSLTIGAETTRFNLNIWKQEYELTTIKTTSICKSGEKKYWILCSHETANGFVFISHHLGYVHTVSFS